MAKASSEQSITHRYSVRVSLILHDQFYLATTLSRWEFKGNRVWMNKEFILNRMSERTMLGNAMAKRKKREASDDLQKMALLTRDRKNER
jgi:hypothetical protein